MKSLYFLGFLFFLSGKFETAKSFKINLPSSSNKNDSDHINLGIVDGKIVKHNKFPYQVGILSLINDQGSAFLCGGVIVTSRWIATAAHCVLYNGKQIPADKIMPRVGLDKFWTKSKPYYPVQSVYIYPNYTITDIDVRGDLALLNLKNDIKFGDGVSSACLDFRYREHEFLYATGYGATQGEIHSAQSDLVYQSRVDGDLLRYARVKESRKLFFCSDPKLYVCVYPEKNGTLSGICQGDSGSAISTPIFDVLGIASTDHPIMIQDYVLDCVGLGRFTRLGAYSNFIDQIIGKDDYCSKR